jgi:hypothetical protein
MSSGRLLRIPRIHNRISLLTMCNLVYYFTDPPHRPQPPINVKHVGVQSRRQMCLKHAEFFNERRMLYELTSTPLQSPCPFRPLAMCSRLVSFRNAPHLTMSHDGCRKAAHLSRNSHPLCVLYGLVHAIGSLMRFFFRGCVRWGRAAPGIGINVLYIAGLGSCYSTAIRLVFGHVSGVSFAWKDSERRRD